MPPAFLTPKSSTVSVFPRAGIPATASLESHAYPQHAQNLHASKASDGQFHWHSGGVAPTWTLHSLAHDANRFPRPHHEHGDPQVSASHARNPSRLLRVHHDRGYQVTEPHPLQSPSIRVGLVTKMCPDPSMSPVISLGLLRPTPRKGKNKGALMCWLGDSGGPTG
jgi:hypothetical protein